MSIGERDARLLQIREWLFGSRLSNVAHCPHCGEKVEWENDTAAFHLQPFSSPEPAFKIFQLQTGAFHIRFRLPNSQDVQQALNDRAFFEQPRKFLARCMVDLNGSEQDIAEKVKVLPAEVFEQLSQQIELEDPQANISFQMNCPACQHEWPITFDIQSYLWAEIDNWAKHVLREVYLLARSFGWSERDILNMHPLRRQLYLEIIGS